MNTLVFHEQKLNYKIIALGHTLQQRPLHMQNRECDSFAHSAQHLVVTTIPMTFA